MDYVGSCMRCYMAMLKMRSRNTRVYKQVAGSWITRGFQGSLTGRVRGFPWGWGPEG